MKVQIEPTPPHDRTNRHHPSNRSPLLPTPFSKLLLGAVKPRGWLAGQIARMVDGLTGRLYEFGPLLRPANGWLEPSAGSGGEEAPYWLRGFHDLAVLSGDGDVPHARDWEPRRDTVESASMPPYRFDEMVNDPLPESMFVRDRRSRVILQEPRR